MTRKCTSNAVLATSVKTDLLRDTIAHRQTVGHVLVFDPVETTGLEAHGWSPLTGASTWHGAQRTAGENSSQLAIVVLCHSVDSLRLPVRYAAYGGTPDSRSPGGVGQRQNW